MYFRSSPEKIPEILLSIPYIWDDFPEYSLLNWPKMPELPRMPIEVDMSTISNPIFSLFNRSRISPTIISVAAYQVSENNFDDVVPVANVDCLYTNSDKIIIPEQFIDVSRQRTSLITLEALDVHLATQNELRRNFSFNENGIVEIL